MSLMAKITRAASAQCVKHPSISGLFEIFKLLHNNYSTSEIVLHLSDLLTSHWAKVEREKQPQTFPHLTSSSINISSSLLARQLADTEKN